MKIKHSKYKNTGLLFELLVRQATADTLKGINSPSIGLIKKYFVKSELGREYKLYETIVKSKVLTEERANIILSTILESSQKLNRSSVKRQKYNLISEIKKHYDLDSFFSTKVKNYKELAAVYTLMEGYNCKETPNTTQIITNKVTLLEYLTQKEISTQEIKEDVFQEFQSYDKDLRILTYKILLEKFNEKYQDITLEQKQILKEFINSVDSKTDLKNFYNTKVNELKSILTKESQNIKDKTTQIKITEVVKLIKELGKTCSITDDHLVDLMQYYELVKEIRSANGVQI